MDGAVHLPNEAQHKLFACREIVRHNPANFRALQQLADAAFDCKLYDLAAGAFRRAISLAPNNADCRFGLGVCLMRQAEWSAAADTLLRSARLDGNEQAREYAITALRLADRIDESEQEIRRWIADSPESSAAFHWAATIGERTVNRVSEQYARVLFDRFAKSFESTLRGTNYRGPTVLAEFLEARIGTQDRAVRAIELGCGTGLCGAAIRPHARDLVGLDLSPSMIAQARDKRIYDQLVVSDLVQYGPFGKKCNIF